MLRTTFVIAYCYILQGCWDLNSETKVLMIRAKKKLGLKSKEEVGFEVDHCEDIQVLKNLKSTYTQFRIARSATK